MLCYHCGTHVPDDVELCPSCGQRVSDGARPLPATFSQQRADAPDADAPFKAGDVVADRYEIKELRGVGPLGYVFRAQDRELDLEVALKVINKTLLPMDEEREQFTKVLRVGRRFSHQNLARLNEVGVWQDWPYYTSQLLQGLTLRKILEHRASQNQTFTLVEIEPILTQIGIALQAAHRLMPHSNLKPENVLVMPDLLKVTDCGLGSALPRGPFVAALKGRKADRYLAPEWHRDGGDIDARTDTYALGVILGEMLTYQTPDSSGTPELQRVRPDLPLAIDALYRKALSTDPANRFQTPGDLLNELTTAIKRVPGPSKVSGESPPVPGPEAITAQNAAEARVNGLRARGYGKTVHSGSAVVGGAAAEDQPIGGRENEKGDHSLDETQPFSAALLPPEISGLLSSQTTPYNSTMLASLPPHSELAHKVRSGEFDADGITRAPKRRRTLPIDEPGDQAYMPTPPLPFNGDGTRPLFGAVAPRGAGPQNLAALWLVLLTAGGLLVGTFGGYFALSRLGRSSSVTVQPSAVKPPPKPAPKPPPKPGPAATTPAGTTAATTPGTTAAATTTPPVPKVVANFKCPEGMTGIPSGVFKMGTAKDDQMMGFDERTLSEVDVDSFCIDTYEYPNRAKEVPMANVTWNEAKKLCEAKGKRLCTEMEWEKACKGPQSMRFPYADTFDANACNTEKKTGEDREVAGAGTFPSCASGFGVRDMSGNVAEWTATPFAGHLDHTQKGGSFDRPDYAARCSARRGGGVSAKAVEVGFRCCKGIAGP